MFKKIISIILSLAILAGVFSALPISASAASSDFSSADDYAAYCLTNGNTDINTGITTGAPIAASAVVYDTIFEIVAEEVIEDGGLVFNSVYWQNLKNALDFDFGNIVNFEESIYTLLLLDFLNCNAESKEYETHLLKTSRKFSHAIYKDILDYSADTYHEEFRDIIASQDKEDLVPFCQKYGYIRKLESFGKITDTIDEISKNATEYYKNLSKALAVQEVSQAQIDYLVSLKAQASGNKHFVNAVNQVIEWYESSYATLALDTGISTMGKYAVNATFDCAIKAYPPLEATIKGLKTYTKGLNWLFNSDDLSENNLKMIFLYIINSYAITAMQQARETYRNDPTDENASSFVNQFLSFLNFEIYASNHTKGFISSAIFDGVVNKIKNLISDSGELSYANFQSRIDADIAYFQNFSKVTNTLYDMYGSTLNHTDVYLIDGGSGSEEENNYIAIYFAVDSYTIFLSQRLKNPISIFYNTHEVSNVDNIKISYSSSNTAIATVDGDGWITPISEGTVTIYASASSGDTASSTITILPYWVNDYNGGFEISYYSGSASNPIIPKYVQGKTVTRIGERAFYNKSNIKNINIPNTVTSIGKMAFAWCNRATSLTIPNSVTTIEDEAFYACMYLTDISIPDSVTSMGYCAFGNCNYLKTVKLSNNLTVIRDSAFYYCPELQSVTIPNKVTSIERQAFGCCESLSSISIPASVTSIGEEVFYDCKNLQNISVDSNNPNYASHDNILFDKTLSTLLLCPANRGGESFAIPNSVTTIAEGAFQYNKNLVNIGIGENVKTIGKWAFRSAEKLENVNISYGVTTIGGGAFMDCYSLKKVLIPDSVTSFGSSMFWNSSSLEEASLPSSLKTIPSSTFANCYELKSIDIPDGVEAIESGAFSSCSSLEKIILPDSVTTVGESAFYFCENLKELRLSENITSLDYDTISYCTNLKSLKLPASISYIPEYSIWGMDDVVFRCYSNSYAANFVKQNNFKYTIINDVSGDGKTDASDLITLIKHLLFGNTVNVEADFNEDGSVNIIDIVRLKKILAS